MEKIILNFQKMVNTRIEIRMLLYIGFQPNVHTFHIDLYVFQVNLLNGMSIGGMPEDFPKQFIFRGVNV